MLKQDSKSVGRDFEKASLAGGTRGSLPTSHVPSF